MTIQEALHAYPTIEADLLLAHTLRVDKEYLYLNPKEILTKAATTKYQELCRKRKEGVPAAYLLGNKYFHDLKFKVTEDVLIPRPESEWLVEQAVEYTWKQIKKQKAGSGKRTWSILDMGTGSGCLIISTAKQLEGRRLDLVAADISAPALTIARQNANYHNVKINFIKSDLFNKVKGGFDIIFANLPYVPRKSFKKLGESLKYEPAIAIATNDDTWEVYKKFFAQAIKHINPGALILLEIDPLQKAGLEKEIKKWMPHAKITFAKDIRGLWRSVAITI